MLNENKKFKTWTEVWEKCEENELKKRLKQNENNEEDKEWLELALSDLWDDDEVDYSDVRLG